MEKRISVRPQRSKTWRSPAFRGELALSIDRILVPVELDEHCSGLLLVAAAFARQLGAQLVLLHTYQALKNAPRHATPREFEEGQEARRREAEAEAAAFLDDYSHIPAIRAAQVVVEPGLLTEEIAEVAAATRANLILIASYSRTGIERIITGSKAACIARHASCPVLVVPDIVLPSSTSRQQPENRWSNFLQVIKRVFLSLGTLLKFRTGQR